MAEKTFGKLIQRERNRRNISLHQLSERTGITPNFIHRIELGENKNLSFYNVCVLSEALTLNLKDVFTLFGHENLYVQSIAK